MSDNLKGGEPTVSVVIVDDDEQAGIIVARYLKPMGLKIAKYTDPERCLADIEKECPDVVITDLRMPRVDGLAVLERVKALHPSTDVIMVTGHADKTVAIQALKMGAFDFFEKPVDSAELIETIKKTLHYRAVVRERDRYAEQVSFLSRREAQRWGIEALIGRSNALRKIVEDIKLVQRTATTVLIAGESGTGKELIARAIHFGGARASHPFIPVNCCAVSPQLAESALFGHARGAFSGAVADVKGCFEMADKGTLFLDEIGDMPLDLQAKLLRVLEDGVVTPVGKTAGRTVDVRVLAASNTDLEKEIASGAFRSDLYYRLARFGICAPPLRDRPEDIPLLVRHFAEVLAVEMGFPSPSVSDEAMALLRQGSYPRNVRQLRNVNDQALIHGAGCRIEPRHLPAILTMAGLEGGTPIVREKASAPRAEGQSLNLEDAESRLIRRAMAMAGGSVSVAARILGITRTKLYRKLPGLQNTEPEESAENGSPEGGI